MNNKTMNIFRYYLICLLLFSSSSYASPVINWAPTKLNIEQMQGAAETYYATIEVTDDLDGAVARVVPELSSWISVTPSTIGDVSKGQKIEVVISVRISPDEAVGTYDGTIHLKQAVLGKPYKTIAKPLPVKLTITEYVGPVLPPDPGSEGDQTLLGVDSDSDGVRDDIQRYIQFTYPDDNLIRSALREYAKQYQILLPTAGDREASFRNAKRLTKDGNCVYAINRPEAWNMLRELRARILNTRERSVAYIQFSDSLGGKTTYLGDSSKWINDCRFDVEAVR